MSSQLQAFGSWRIILLNSDDIGDDGDVLTRVGENAAAFLPAGGGNPFDQDLNTDDDVVFGSVETSAITMPGDSDPLFTVDPVIAAMITGDYVLSNRPAYYTSAPIFDTDIDLEPSKQVYLTGLGETLSQNSDFDGNADDWTLAGGWAYNDGGIVHSAGIESDASQAMTTTSGRTNNVYLIISGRTAGSLTVLFQNGDSKTLSINGEFGRIRLGAGENDTFILRASSDFDGKVEFAEVSLLEESGIAGDSSGLLISTTLDLSLTIPGALNINGTPGVTDAAVVVDGVTLSFTKGILTGVA